MQSASHHHSRDEIKYMPKVPQLVRNQHGKSDSKAQDFALYSAAAVKYTSCTLNGPAATSTSTLSQ